MCNFGGRRMSGFEVIGGGEGGGRGGSKAPADRRKQKKARSEWD